MTKTSIAYFISPHGFGHATRSSAIIRAYLDQAPDTDIHVFTSVPRHCFDDCIANTYHYHYLACDIGYIQASPLTADLPATIAALNRFLPFDDRIVDGTAAIITRAGCDLVICDIAPIGLVVATRSGVPSVLIENFTWNWLYESDVPSYPALERHRCYLADIFKTATHHIQLEPACCPITADLSAPPVWRQPKSSADAVRKQLAIPDSARIVTITLGGTDTDTDPDRWLHRYDDVCFILPGTSHTPLRAGNVIRLPRDSDVYFPDLIASSDVVIGKLGYGTVMEVYAADSVFGYITRNTFRESPILEAFVKTYLRSMKITQKDYENDSWLDIIGTLLALPARAPTMRKNGTDCIAAYLARLSTSPQEQAQAR